ncbi:nickel ABC transporter substrate-binding protein [Ammoniphilus sp. YIM 78166]|uniref:nickel ABC transporter substrate-binding protein n=1 Tax=Ammoniphilus sp. YIM 78166 TaxID=1644106 RepID=UPI0010704804|nr:nickel ABC transporter substrate-binding protein [Ammoniphilus sp. YIM 78166]
MRSFKFFGPLMLSAALLLTGCGAQDQGAAEKTEATASQKEDVKKVTMIYNFKTGSMDPHNGAVPLRAGVVETLVRMENLELKPWLATKWESKDEHTWVFTIREGVTFHDGKSLDAAAVKASFERALAVNPKNVGALKIASMEANGQELTIVTSEPNPALPSDLVNPQAAIVNAEAEATMGSEKFNTAPVGTGPFKVKQFTPDIEVVVERYDEYWDGQPKLNELTFKFNEDANVRALALQSREADIVYQVPAETIDVIQKVNDLRVESLAGLRVHFLLYNQQKPWIQDVRVRKAMDLLLNRESIANDIMLGNATPANGPFNTALPFGSKEPATSLDIEGAKKLLEEAGFEAGANGLLAKDGQPLKLELLTYQGRPELPLMAQLLQSDASKAGVTIDIKTVENIDTYLRENKDWDLATYSVLSAPRGDGGFFLNSAFLPGGSLNAADVNIASLNSLVEKLNGTVELQERLQLTQEAVGIIKEEVPHSYAVYPNIIVGMNERIVDWSPGAEEYYMVTHKMDVK